MKARTIWNENFKSIVDNGRGHEIVCDLPPAQNGDDMGATALEVCLMSYSGCVATIFAMMAKKMRIEFSALEVDVEGEKSEETGTIGDVIVNVNIESEQLEEKIRKCMDMTLKTCPVGVLFANAGVQSSYNLNIKATV
ncbi:OsmC family peroxiredoxin [Puteibacter caeruleilacunae]|nr:OsmC family peroxiredoxin [Puteibacter caeruleilacunae]